MPGTKASGGRNSKGRQFHVLAGSFRADRHVSQAGVDAPKGQPEPLKPLAGDALDEWQRMLVRMEQIGTLSPVHDAVLYQYCQLFAETEQLVVEKAEARAAVDRLLESQGDIEAADLLTFFQEVGKMQKLAGGYDSKIRSNRMALRQFLVEFGLTPVALSRVGGKAPNQSDEEDALAKLLAVK